MFYTILHWQSDLLVHSTSSICAAKYELSRISSHSIFPRGDDEPYQSKNLFQVLLCCCVLSGVVQFDCRCFICWRIQTAAWGKQLCFVSKYVLICDAVVDPNWLFLERQLIWNLPYSTVCTSGLHFFLSHTSSVVVLAHRHCCVANFFLYLLSGPLSCQTVLEVGIVSQDS